MSLGPVIPLIMIGGAVTLLGGKKRGAKNRGSGEVSPDPIGAMIANIDSAHPIEKKPWARCRPPAGSSKGTYAAYDENLSCVVFWRPETTEVVTSYMRSELDKLPESERDALCSPDNCMDDPYAIDPSMSCNWTIDPNREAFIRAAVTSLFPQLKNEKLPPTESDPYFNKMVYTLIAGAFTEGFCGFNLVT